MCWTTCNADVLDVRFPSDKVSAQRPGDRYKKQVADLYVSLCLDGATKILVSWKTSYEGTEMPTSP
jgi:hypothetical protein